MISPATLLLVCMAMPEPDEEDFFGQTPGRAAKLPGKAPALAIYLAELRRGNEREFRVPGDAELASGLNCSESTIRRAWRELEGARVFARGDRYRSNGRDWRIVHVLFRKRGEGSRAHASTYAPKVARTNAQPVRTSDRAPTVLGARASDSERKTDTVSSPSGGIPPREPETGRVASLDLQNPEPTLTAPPAPQVVVTPAAPVEAPGFVEIDLAEVESPLAHLTDAELDDLARRKGAAGASARFEQAIRRRRAEEMGAAEATPQTPETQAKPATTTVIPCADYTPAHTPVTPSAPQAFAAPIGPKRETIGPKPATNRPRHVSRDSTVRLGTLLDLIAQLRAAPPGDRGSLVGRLVDLACTRWRDHAIATRSHFRAAFSGLDPGLLIDLVGDCDSAGKDPARLFSHKAARALEAQRQAQESHP